MLRPRGGEHHSQRRWGEHKSSPTTHHGEKHRNPNRMVESKDRKVGLKSYNTVASRTETNWINTPNRLITARTSPVLLEDKPHGQQLDLFQRVAKSSRFRSGKTYGQRTVCSDPEAGSTTIREDGVSTSPK